MVSRFDQDRFQQQADVLNIVLDHITQGIVVVGPDYRTLAFNRPFEEIFQLPAGSVEVGTDFRDILRVWARETGQDQQMLDLAIKELDEQDSFEFEFPQSIKGDIRWCLLTHNPLPEKKGFVRTFTDITKRKALEASLTKLSREDSLTGLINRRTLMDILEEEMTRSQRYQRSMSLLMIDLDHFKRINDQWGHQMGDDVLKNFASQCEEAMRENDKIGRWGGEEFVMLLPETEQSEAEDVANRLRSLTSSMVIRPHTGDSAVRVTVSIGIASTQAGDTVETLLTRADNALYDAKTAGRNRVACR
ncbi:MAG: diguanylate cyclase [Sulfuricellaceae bacterium]|nr:diguanylate cyclase [Sulfuricellaceae bacterium]